MTPAQIPTHPIPPKGCPECEFNCPLQPACPPPTTLCTHAQLDSNILKCPACIPQAGCKQIGCPCKDCQGNVYDPPINPPQPVGQKGCPVCPTDCIVTAPICPLLSQCTEKQLKTYDVQCPQCIATASCKQPGCNCIDVQGNMLTSPTNPPQPPRPKGCPVCDPACIFSPLSCPPPVQCTAEQLATYVPI